MWVLYHAGHTFTHTMGILPVCSWLSPGALQSSVEDVAG